MTCKGRRRIEGQQKRTKCRDVRVDLGGALIYWVCKEVGDESGRRRANEQARAHLDHTRERGNDTILLD
jgi:hypothetical protein